MNNKLVTLILIFGVCIHGCVSADSSISKNWSEYLAKPNKENYKLLTNQITETAKRCDWGSKHNSVAVPENIRNELFDNIAAGKGTSLAAGFYIERCLDGGDLEDLYRSAGQYFERNPNIFLQEITDFSISTDKYTSMLIMLPLDLVDDVGGKISAIRDRIKILENVNSKKYLELKNAGLLALKKEEKSLGEIGKSK